MNYSWASLVYSNHGHYLRHHKCKAYVFNIYSWAPFVYSNHGHYLRHHKCNAYVFNIYSWAPLVYSNHGHHLHPDVYSSLLCSSCLPTVSEIYKKYILYYYYLYLYLFFMAFLFHPTCCIFFFCPFVLRIAILPLQ
jgi:hypothetical protein